MARVPIRLSRKRLRVLGEPLLASSRGDSLNERRLGDRGDIDPELSCALERLDIERQGRLALGRYHHMTLPHNDTVDIYRSLVCSKLHGPELPDQPTRIAAMTMIFGIFLG